MEVEVDEEKCMNFKLIVFAVLPLVLVVTTFLYNISVDRTQYYLDNTTCADAACVDQ